MTEFSSAFTVEWALKNQVTDIEVLCELFEEN